MKEAYENNQYSQESIAAITPASELLSDVSTIHRLRPEHPIDERELLQRKHTANESARILDALPKHPIDVDVLVGQSVLQPEDATKLYDSLRGVLEDPEYYRLALYLPFEILPSQKWQPEDANLALSAHMFRRAYIEAWSSQLLVHDARANFVDGDVLEVEHRSEDIPRVVKAAHLIPRLLERGLVDQDEIDQLYRTTRNPVLQRSIREAFGEVTDWRQHDPAASIRRQAWLVSRHTHGDIIEGEDSTNFSRNFERLDELPALKNLVASIKDDEQLSALIHPVVAVGGSRLKGYGTDTSDLDVNVFVRDTTDDNQRDEVRALLAEHFDRYEIQAVPNEFWLQGQTLRTFEDAEVVIANSEWSHIPLNAGFIGSTLEVDRVRAAVFAACIQEGRNKVLQRQEQDILQYRLMHDGYARFSQRVTPPAQTSVDGESYFWDAGYRRLATKLFMSKVYLPK